MLFAPTSRDMEDENEKRRKKKERKQHSVIGGDLKIH